jgi:hypothetical protein
VRIVAVDLLPVAIALAVGVLVAVVWWVFDAAPPESRRRNFDLALRSRGQQQLEKGSRRVSFRLWLASMVAVLVLLIWLAMSNR